MAAQQAEVNAPEGCAHYKRSCKILAPCCGKWYWCRHCHNEEHDREEQGADRHILNRHNILMIECAQCKRAQPVAHSCRWCRTRFGNYTCLICNFFDHDSGKRQFHCRACGICRVGGQENFFHCETCGCCYDVALKDNHQCVANNLQQPCPVCGEVLFDSVRQLAILSCGHALHQECQDSLNKLDFPGCLICHRTQAECDATRQLVENAAAKLLQSHTELGTPATAQGDSAAASQCHVHAVFCVFCRKRTDTAAHAFGRKCAECGSFCN